MAEKLKQREREREDITQKLKQTEREE